ncbi:MAG: WbqC family protein [Imperialibacter sp.]|uniref:WbqC family protein n=1 Tax=Imperialibacter sp. TaxID=2038411 RepID=UPI0032EC9D13
MGAEKIVVSEFPLLPCIEYFAVWESFDKVIFDVHENYIKQSYRNRCIILGANGPLALTVPVRHTAPKIPFHEVLIDNSIPWQRPFWKGILSAYGKSPFFEFFGEDFKMAILSPTDRLLDFNEKLLSLCLKCAGLSDKFLQSEKYLLAKDFDFTDLRSKISPKSTNGEIDHFVPTVYQQNFGSEFVPNLSILDLIFCEGPNALHIIKKSSVKWPY